MGPVSGLLGVIHSLEGLRPNIGDFMLASVREVLLPSELTCIDRLMSIVLIES